MDGWMRDIFKEKTIPSEKLENPMKRMKRVKNMKNDNKMQNPHRFCNILRFVREKVFFSVDNK